MKETIAFIAAIIAFVGNVPYLKDMVQKKVQPHPYTWLVWSVVSGITLAGIIAKGGGVGALPVAVAEIFTIIIFLFSIRYGFKNIPKIDNYFLVVALIGLIPWFITKDPTISVIVAVSIDVIAFIPTLRKAWRMPTSEVWILYGMNIVRHTLILFSLQAYVVATMLHSIAMITMNIIMTAILVARSKSNK